MALEFHTHCHRVTGATHQVAHVETLAKAANPTCNTATQVFEDTGNVQPWWLTDIYHIRFPGKLPPKGWRYSRYIPIIALFKKKMETFFGILREEKRVFASILLSCC